MEKRKILVWGKLKRYSRFFMIGINAIRFYGEMAE